MIDCYAARSRETQGNRLRIRSRRHHEVILQLSLLAVIDKIHAGIYILIPYLAVGGYVGLPQLAITATKIVGLARQFIYATDRGERVRAHEFHAKHSSVSRIVLRRQSEIFGGFWLSD